MRLVATVWLEIGALRLEGGRGKEVKIQDLERPGNPEAEVAAPEV